MSRHRFTNPIFYLALLLILLPLQQILAAPASQSDDLTPVATETSTEAATVTETPTITPASNCGMAPGTGLHGDYYELEWNNDVAVVPVGSPPLNSFCLGGWCGL